jgi:hypothetical protein
MDNFINWRPCDKWDGDYNPITKQTTMYHVARELVCTHPEVEKVWFHGSLSAAEKREDRVPELNFEMVLKDGRRFAARNIPADCYETGNIPQAEDYLRTLISKTEA